MRKIAFLVLPEFSNLGLAAAMEPLFVANWLAQRTLFEWQVVSVDGKPVRASNGREVSVDGALSELAKREPQVARLVELRFFAGLTLEEAAKVLGLSERKAYRHWAYARAWLRRALDQSRDSTA